VWVGEREPIIVGPMTRPVVSPLAPGTTIVGVRLRPGACLASLGVSARELRDVNVELTHASRRAANALLKALSGSPPVELRVDALEAALSHWLGAAPAPDLVVLAAIDLLLRDSRAHVRDLARSVGVSERTFRRRFDTTVGYGPKMLQRVLRLQRLRAAAASQRRIHLSLSMTAAELGYADQAHMTRDIGRLAGISPRRLVERAPSWQILSEPLVTGDPVLHDRFLQDAHTVAD